MKLLRFLLPAILLLLLVLPGQPAAAATQRSGERLVILTDEREEYPLGLYLDILEDPTGRLTINDVTSPEWAGRFVANEVEVPNYGFASSAYWVRFQVRNEARLKDEWRLELGFANMHYVDFYRPAAEGPGFDVVQTGVLRPIASRDIPYHRFVFALPLLPQSEQTVYLHFASQASMTLPLTLWSRPAFEQQAQAELLALGLFYGALGVMLAYNLFLLFSLKERSYLYYCLFLASFMLFQSAYDGIGPRYLWPELTAGNRSPILLFFNLLFLFLIRFTMVFLQAGRAILQLQRLLAILLLPLGLLVLLIPFTPYRFVVIADDILGLLALLAITITSLISWRRGHRPAGLFMMAWLLFLVGAVITIPVRLQIFPSTLVTEHGYQLGIVLAGLLLSLALADQLNLLKASAEKSSRHLAESEQRLAHFLEAMPLGVTVFDAAGRLHYSNEIARRFSQPAQLLRPGQTLADMEAITPFYLAGSQQPYPAERLPLQQALKGKAAVIDDLELSFASQRIPLQIWGNPVWNEQGQVEYAITAFQDISKRRRAETALQESEERYRALVAHSLAAIYLYDPDSRRVLQANPAFCNLLGYQAEEATHLTLYDFIVRDRADLDNLTEQIRADGGANLGERQWRRKDGTLVRVHVTVGSFQQAGRTLFFVVAHDISTLKLLEDRLAAVYRLGQELVLVHDEAAILQRVLQVIGNTLPFDLVACHLVNEAAGQLVNRYQLADGMIEAGTLHLPLDSEQSINVAVVRRGEAINLGDTSQDSRYLPYPGNRAFRSELCVPMKLGKLVVGTFNVESVVANQYTPADQELLQVLASQATVALENAYLFKAERQARQLAETQRAANLALSQSLELDAVLATLLDYLGQLVPYDSASVFLLAGNNSLVIRAHRGYEQWWQSDPSQVAGLSLDVKKATSLQTVLATGKSLLIADTECYPGWLAVEGSEYIRNWLGVPLVAGGQIIGLYSLDQSRPAVFTQEHVHLAEALAAQAAVAIQNASLYQAEREQYRRLELSQAQLLQAEKMGAVGRLAASIAHEINNPLQSIQGLLALLAEQVGHNGHAEELNHYLSVVNDEIERIAWVVRDMRSFSRPATASWEMTDVLAILENVLKLAAKQLEQSEIVVQWPKPEELPLIWANADHLKQVFLNLVLNAMDAMPQGGRLLVTTAVGEMINRDQDGAIPAIRVEFSDTGIGMSPEVLAHIFEPFFTTKEQSTGLGLTISYGIIEAHNGQISAASEVGKGTIVTLLLPNERIDKEEGVAWTQPG
jgi:PAS domain S-box-containing protein